MTAIEKIFPELMEGVGFPANTAGNEAQIAVAVSGGADSMALTLLLNEWGQDHNCKINALTVNHGLRKEAAKEAEQVRKWLKKCNINHHILTYSGEKPQSNIQEEARNIRYSLMLEWCKANNISSLFVAHHMEDQAETFLLRLERGSGIDGLAAMLPVSERDGIHIRRPLLEVTKNQLKQYLNRQNQKWIDDPSNNDTAHKRNNLRKVLQKIGDITDSVLTKRLADTAHHMARARAALELESTRHMAACVTLHPAGFCTFHHEKFVNIPEEIALRILSRILITISGSREKPRFDKLENLYNSILDNPDRLRGVTLHGCKVFKPPRKKQQLVFIYREPARIQENLAVTKDIPLTWDSRFTIEFSGQNDSGLVVGVVENLPENLPKTDIPTQIIRTFPALKQAGAIEKTLAIPHINYYADGFENLFSCEFTPAIPLAKPLATSDFD